MTTQQEADQRQKYYITTAIDYPNAPPHIGHALEKVAADVIARYSRLQDHDTYFSIGLDENSQHVVRAARTHDTDPLTWVKQMDEAFRLAWSKLDISYDYWMRTTEERHFRASQEMFQRAWNKGDIYSSIYSGWYCPNDNTFYTSEELVDGHCPNHPSIIPEWLEEENYFFALSNYTDRLLTHIEAHPEFIVPMSRRAEVVGLLKQGLRDFSVSRIARSELGAWGVPVPVNPEHVIYVWFDALTNYLTAIGFPDDTQKFEHYWPADAHVIGKDITRFHCLYWPAMLLSADLPLPKQVAVHGFITLDGQRISKTTGNTIDPVALVNEFGTDAVRYSLLRNLSFTSDGDFSRSALLHRYNDELGNDLGNLLNRVVSMIQRYRSGSIPTAKGNSSLEEDLQRVATETLQVASTALETWDIGGALNATWNLVRRANQYIEQCEPWKLAREGEQQERLDTVLYSATEATRLIALLLAPYIPMSSNCMFAQLGLGDVREGAWVHDAVWSGVALTTVVPGNVLFPRREEHVSS